MKIVTAQLQRYFACQVGHLETSSVRVRALHLTGVHPLKRHINGRPRATALLSSRLASSAHALCWLYIPSRPSFACIGIMHRIRSDGPEARLVPRSPRPVFARLSAPPAPLPSSTAPGLFANALASPVNMATHRPPRSTSQKVVATILQMHLQRHIADRYVQRGVGLTKTDDPEDNPTLIAWTPRKQRKILHGSALSDIPNSKAWGEDGESGRPDKEQKSQVINGQDICRGGTSSPLTSPSNILLKPVERTVTPSPSHTRTQTPAPSPRHATEPTGNPSEHSAQEVFPILHPQQL